MGALQEELYGCDDADYDNWYDRERINSKDAAWMILSMVVGNIKFTNFGGYLLIAFIHTFRNATNVI